MTTNFILKYTIMEKHLMIDVYILLENSCNLQLIKSVFMKKK